MLGGDSAAVRAMRAATGELFEKSCQLSASSSRLLKISNLVIKNAPPRLTHSVKPARPENL